MTSPAIQSNEKDRKTRKASEGPSENETPTTSSTSPSLVVANIVPSYNLFAWLRIFRLVDSLMRTQC